MALIGSDLNRLDLPRRLLAQGLLGRAMGIWESLGADPDAARCRRALALLG